MFNMIQLIENPTKWIVEKCIQSAAGRADSDSTLGFKLCKKRGIINVRKLSSQVSMCSPHSRVRDDAFRQNRIVAEKRLTIKAESVVPDWPVHKTLNP